MDLTVHKRLIFMCGWMRRQSGWWWWW